MRISTRTRIVAAALAAFVLVPAAPAAAKYYTSPVGTAEVSNQDESGAVIIPRLPRSPSEATPFVAEVGTEAIRKDASQATPFVAEVAPEATPPGDKFDWGDAAIGAGAGLLIVTVIAATSAATGGRRRYSPSSGGPASQGA